jgi:DNA-binding NtrC family response regulator
MLEQRQPIRVLVVDDRPEITELIAEDLSDRGYDSLAETSARAAMRILHNERIDVLVTDVRMPEMDGLELLRRSRELDPTRPVILMTAFEALDAAIEASELGACHYLRKPFRLDVLARLLREVIPSQ